MAGARYPRIVRLAILAVLVVGALWLLVRLMQPSMAFFPMRGVQRTPEAFALPYQTLQIDTADGVRLHGWWMPHPQAMGRCMVLVHGYADAKVGSRLLQPAQVQRPQRRHAIDDPDRFDQCGHAASTTGARVATTVCSTVAPMTCRYFSSKYSVIVRPGSRDRRG